MQDHFILAKCFYTILSLITKTNINGKWNYSSDRKVNGKIWILDIMKIKDVRDIFLANQSC